MTPEARAYIDKARQCLARAQAILSIGIGDDAGRAAYLGAFHAAQAFIFERAGKVAKTHRGVHSQLIKLVRDEPRLPPELTHFLRESYDLKTVADYEVGPDAVVPLPEAREAVETAGRFIAAIAALLGETALLVPSRPLAQRLLDLSAPDHRYCESEGCRNLGLPRNRNSIWTVSSPRSSRSEARSCLRLCHLLRLMHKPSAPRAAKHG